MEFFRFYSLTLAIKKLSSSAEMRTWNLQELAAAVLRLCEIHLAKHTGPKAMPQPRHETPICQWPWNLLQLLPLLWVPHRQAMQTCRVTVLTQSFSWEGVSLMPDGGTGRQGLGVQT